jgi:hypothetical protein
MTMTRKASRRKRIRQRQRHNDLKRAAVDIQPLLSLQTPAPSGAVKISTALLIADLERRSNLIRELVEEEEKTGL